MQSLWKNSSCTDAIIKSRIKKIIIACQDPHKIAQGGISRLKKAGIKIKMGVLEKEAEEINTYFFYAMTHKRPYLIQKSAITLDGKIWSKKEKNITGEKTKKEVHLLRNEVDAILVGVNTVLQDNPQLTCRIKNGKDPLRIILDSSLKIPLHANVLNDTHVLILTTDKKNKNKETALKKKNINVLSLGKSLTPKKVLSFLHTKEIRSILLEGGTHMNTSFLPYANEFHLFIAPKLFGEIGSIPLFTKKMKKSFHIISTSILDNDLYLIAKPKQAQSL